MSQETHGKAEKLKGRAKEAAGIVTGNKELEKEGSRQRTHGTVQEGLGKVRREVGEALESIAESIKK